ncbi:Chaperone protein DnaJ [compost metagenome]
MGSWIEGMRYLPPPTSLPEYFRELGFESTPSDAAEVENRYRALAKQRHPDVQGGDGEAFKELHAAYVRAKQHFEGI